MSKAFTKEDDGDDPLPAYQPPWPAGARNYVTPRGHAQLRSERGELVNRVLPPLVGDVSSRGALREARRRLAILDAHLEAAEVVAPVVGPVSQVQFGTTVHVSGERERTYSIVGVDEVDAGRGRVSWLSPIARALTGRKVGDEVVLRSPRGEEDLTIVRIEPLTP